MNKSKNAKVSLAKQLIAGTQKHFGTASSLAFASATFTPAQVATSLQTIVELRSAVDTAKASTKVKVSTEAEQTPALDALTAAYIAFVRTTFAKSPDVLADFGLKPKKTSTPPTVKRAGGCGREARVHARGAKHDGNGAEEEGEGRRDERHHHLESCIAARRVAVLRRRRTSRLRLRRQSAAR